MKKFLYILVLIGGFISHPAFGQNNMIIHQGNGTKIILPLQSIDSVRYQLTPPPVLQKIYQNNGNILSVSVNDIDSITFYTPNPNSLPTLSTQNITVLSNSSASGGGTVLTDGGSPVLQRGVCWNTSPNPTIANNFTNDGNGIGGFLSTMTPLLPSTTYYVRAYATNANGTSYGNQVIFTTSTASNGGSLPTITTSPIVYLDSLSAFSGGNITADGGLAVTARGVCWAIGSTPTINNSHTIDGAGGGSFNSRVFNLLPNTSYFVRAYATNAAGTAYGITYSFTTKGLPTVITDSVSTVWAMYAKVHGNVVSDGGSTVSDRGICWSTSPNPTIANNKVSPYAWTLNTYYSFASSLPSNTIIYFRAFAGNGIGYAYGNELVATTKNGIPTVIADSITNIRALEASISSRIIDDGGSQIIKRGVCWSSAPNPTTNDSFTSDGGNQFESFISNPNNLLPNTTYYLRAYATTSIGTGYSKQFSFKTKDGIPVISLDSIYDISLINAKSVSNIINDGGSLILERGICWSLFPNPTINNSRESDGGSSIGVFYNNLTILNPDTIYYVRAYARTSIGTGYSSEISFRTQKNCSVLTSIVDVINSITGKTWMDRNIGAARAAISISDSLAYGDLFQWGRRSDGHQCRNSNTTSTLSSIDQPTNSNFIVTSNAPNDWRIPQNTNLWQGLNGVNNPCPNGYRLPSETEINAERLSWSTNNAAGAFASPLKLLAGGIRIQNGSLIRIGVDGFYWSSSVVGNNSYCIFFSFDFPYFSGGGYNRAYGLSVRCIKD